LGVLQCEGHARQGSWPAALIELAKTLDLDVPKAWIFEDEGYSGATLRINRTSVIASPGPRGAVTFIAGRDWREHTFDLSDFGVDTRRVLWVNLAAGPEPGRFAFQIDEVRLRSAVAQGSLLESSGTAR